MLLLEFIRILDLDTLKEFMRFDFFMNYHKEAYLTNPGLMFQSFMMTLNSTKDCVYTF